MAKTVDWLARIIDKPDDEDLRLEYAKWLDGRGDPRGEFIRVQCALARLVPDDPPFPTFDERGVEPQPWQLRDSEHLPFFGDPHWAPRLPNVAAYSTHRRAALPEEGELRELLLREEGLLGRHAEGWLADLDPAQRGGQFRRGLLERVRLEAGHFFDRGKDLLKRAPLREFCLDNLGPKGAERLAKDALLKRVVSLAVEGEPIGTQGAEALLASPHLGALESLSLARQEIGGGCADLLTDAKNLTSLRRICLAGNDINFNGPFDKAVTAKHLRTLQAIDLCDTDLWCEFVRPLLRSKHHHLTELDLGDCGVNNGEIKALATSPGAASLTALNLNATRLSPSNLKVLASSTHLRGLTRLGLSGSGLSDKSLAVLFDSDILDTVEWLDLSSNGLSDKGAALLAASPHVGRLRELNLSSTKVGLAGLEALTTSDNLPALRVVHLNNCPLNKAAKTSGGDVARLTTLNAWKCGLDDRGAHRLLSLPCLANLEALHLGGNTVSAKGLDALASLSRLTHLQLDNTQLGEGEFSFGERGLRSLHLRDTGLTALPAGNYADLRSLDLSGCALGPAGAHVLAQTDLPHLRELNLSGCGVGDEGLEALVAAPFAPRLLALNVANNGLTDRAATLLATTERLHNLRALDLRGQRFAARLVHQLRAAPGLPRLHSVVEDGPLKVEGNPLHGPGELEDLLPALLKRQPQLAGMHNSSHVARESGSGAWQSDFIGMIQFTLNGWLATSISPTGEVALWDTATGAVLRRLHITPCEGRVAVSPDARRLACVTVDGEWHVWDLVALRLVQRVETGQGYVSGLAFAPDNDTVATAGHDGEVRLWSAASGKERKRLACSKKALNAVAFASDGQTLAVNDDDGQVTLWNCASGKQVRRLTGDDENSRMRVNCLTFSPDGRYLGAASRNLALWRLAEGDSLVHHYTAASVFFTRGGRLAVAVEPSRWNVEVYEAEKQRHRMHVGCTEDSLLVAALPCLRPDGTEVDEIPEELLRPAGRTADAAPVVSLPAVSGATTDELNLAHDHPTKTAALSPDRSLLATGGEDQMVRLWDAGSGKILRRWPADSPIQALAFSPDGAMIVVATNWGEVFAWDLATCRLRWSAKNANDTASLVRFLDGGKKVLVGYEDSRSVRYDADGGSRWPVDGDRCGGVTPDETQLLCVESANAASLRRIEDNAVVRSFKGHTERVSALALSPDGQLVATWAADKTLRLWDATDGRELRRARVKECRLLRFMPNGKALVGSDEKGVVHFWRTSDLHEIHKLTLHKGQVHQLDFAGAGRLLTASEDGAVRLFRLDESLLRQIDAGTAPDLAVTVPAPKATRYEAPLWTATEGQQARAAWAPDGTTVVSTSYTGVVNVWDAATGAQRASWKAGSQAGEVIVSRDGKSVYTCHTTATLAAFDLASGEKLYSTRAKENSFGFFTPTPDGTLLAIAANRSIRFHDPATGKLRRSIILPYGSATAPRYSPDGALLAAGVLHQVHIWDARTGAALYAAGHDGLMQVHAVAFSPDGRTLATGDHGTGVMLWDLATMKMVKAVNCDAINALTFTPDGRFLIAGTSSRAEVLLLDVKSGEVLHTLKHHQWHVGTVELAPDGYRLLTTGGSGEVSVWDLRDFYAEQGYSAPPQWPAPAAPSSALPPSNCAILTVPHAYSVPALAPLADGRVVSSDTGKQIHLWHVETGKVEHVWKLKEETRCLAVAPDGGAFAGWSKKDAVTVWDLATYQPRYSVKLEGEGGNTIAWARATNRIAVSSGNSLLSIWDAGDPKKTLRQWKKAPAVNKLLWLPDGRRLVRVGDKVAQVWDSETERVLHEFESSGSLFGWNAALNPDASLLAIIDEYRIHLFDMNTRQEVRTLNSERSYAIAFGPDGRHLAASEKEAINLWDVTTGAKLYTWCGHPSMPHSLAFSADGRFVISGGSGGYDDTARVWRVPLEPVMM